MGAQDRAGHVEIGPKRVRVVFGGETIADTTATVKVGAREARSTARWYRDSSVAALQGTVRFEWSAMDSWFEEDVEVDGVTVGESDKPRLLFETGLPPRHYLPKTDVRLDLLSPTSKVTGCPYKGRAQYYAVHVNGAVDENLAWWYQHPTLECAKIAGYVCFYDELVDTDVDGVRQPRPQTPFA